MTGSARSVHAKGRRNLRDPAPSPPHSSARRRCPGTLPTLHMYAQQLLGTQCKKITIQLYVLVYVVL